LLAFGEVHLFAVESVAGALCGEVFCGVGEQGFLDADGGGGIAAEEGGGFAVVEVAADEGDLPTFRSHPVQDAFGVLEGGFGGELFAVGDDGGSGAGRVDVAEAPAHGVDGVVEGCTAEGGADADGAERRPVVDGETALFVEEEAAVVVG